MSSTTNNDSSWSTSYEISSLMKGDSAYGHTFSSDGQNVWVVWGQQTAKGIVDLVRSFGCQPDRGSKS